MWRCWPDKKYKLAAGSLGKHKAKKELVKRTAIIYCARKAAAGEEEGDEDAAANGRAEEGDSEEEGAGEEEGGDKEDAEEEEGGDEDEAEEEGDKAAGEPGGEEKGEEEGAAPYRSCCSASSDLPLCRC